MPPHNAPSWKSLCSDLEPDCEFRRPATEDQLAAVQVALGIQVPDSLGDFLRETDGLIADYGSRVVWSASDIAARNREMRNDGPFRRLYMSFESLFLFGDDSGGDRYAFVIQADGQIHRRKIFRWDHETDSRSWSAGHLEHYLEKRLKAREDEPFS
ncbi:SMI1/KNR4 family protein [Paludisphaera soli]|uniref:SMI1/KNR4 family protein n=1 Tax=Paludisphaera soli TaxID=2712865 RepID=UPI0013ED60BD|nr:SMI1/KNR4 family protein [Paludisphaera soli]